MDLSNTTGNILHILNNQSLEKLKDHPFFWKNSTILSFILRSSNYLTDGNNDQIKRIFGWTPPDEAKAVKKGSEKEPQLRFGNYNAGLRINPEAWIEQSIMERLKISYPNIVGHLQESPHSKEKCVEIQNFFWLLKQIRNKVISKLMFLLYIQSANLFDISL